MCHEPHGSKSRLNQEHTPISSVHQKIPVPFTKSGDIKTYMDTIQSKEGKRAKQPLFMVFFGIIHLSTLLLSCN